MKRFSSALATAVMCICLLAAMDSAEAASGHHSSGLKMFGDIMQFALPAAALAVPVLKSDTEGDKQWMREMVSGMGTTYAAKAAFNSTYLGRRPGKDHSGYSFPSGHTASACAGSAFLGDRYGWKYGLPAFGLAALTGYSRVDANEHHWRDVIAGCAISYTAAHFFVTKQGDDTLYPVIGPNFIGFRLDVPFW